MGVKPRTGDVTKEQEAIRNMFPLSKDKSFDALKSELSDHVAMILAKHFSDSIARRPEDEYISFLKKTAGESLQDTVAQIQEMPYFKRMIDNLQTPKDLEKLARKATTMNGKVLKEELNKAKTAMDIENAAHKNRSSGITKSEITNEKTMKN